jgi:hypothetical protein
MEAACVEGSEEAAFKRSSSTTAPSTGQSASCSVNANPSEAEEEDQNPGRACCLQK